MAALGIFSSAHEKLIISLWSHSYPVCPMFHEPLFFSCSCGHVPKKERHFRKEVLLFS